MNHSKDFSKQTVKALKNKGIVVYSRTWLPGVDGSYANGETGYIINDNGTSKVRTFLQVLEMGK